MVIIYDKFVITKGYDLRVSATEIGEMRVKERPWCMAADF